MDKERHSQKRNVDRQYSPIPLYSGRFEVPDAEHVELESARRLRRNKVTVHTDFGLTGFGDRRESDDFGPAYPGSTSLHSGDTVATIMQFGRYSELERELAELEDRLAKPQSTQSPHFPQSSQSPRSQSSLFTSRSQTATSPEFWSTTPGHSSHFQQRQEQYRQNLTRMQAITESVNEPTFELARHDQVSPGHHAHCSDNSLHKTEDLSKADKTGKTKKTARKIDQVGRERTDWKNKRNNAESDTVAEVANRRTRQTDKRTKESEEAVIRDRTRSRQSQSGNATPLFSVIQSVVTAVLILAVFGGVIVMSQKHDLKQMIPNLYAYLSKNGTGSKIEPFAENVGEMTGEVRITSQKDLELHELVGASELSSVGPVQRTVLGNETVPYIGRTENMSGHPGLNQTVPASSPVESSYKEELLTLQSTLQDTQQQLQDRERQFQQTLQKKEDEYSARLIAESLLRESLFQLGRNEQSSLKNAIQASQKFQELNLETPDLCGQVLAQALASISSGDVLISSMPEMETMTLSPSGKWLLTSNADRGIWIWDVSKKSVGLEGGYQLDSSPVSIVKLLFTPDESWVIAARADGMIQCWNVTLESPAESARVFNERIPGLSNLQISPNGRWLTAYGTPKINTKSEMNMIPAPLERLESNQPQSKQGGVFLWDLQNLSHELPRSLVLNGERPVFCSSFSPNSRWLVLGGEDRSVRLYDLNSNQPTLNHYVFRGHQLDVTTLEFCPDNKHFVSGSRDNTVRIWNLPNEQGFIDEPVVLQGHNGWITALAWSEDGKTLATTSYDRTIRLWDCESILAKKEQSLPRVLMSEQGILSEMVFSANRSTLITRGNEGTLRIWNLQNDSSPCQSLSLKGTVIAFQLTDHREWLLLGLAKSGKTDISSWPLTLNNLLEVAQNVSQINGTSDSLFQQGTIAGPVQETNRR
ncbi:MAG: WD40 repeat domain-containing protein [Thermoguttaceae bacterium]